MKKTAIVVMLVLLALVFVSCKQEAEHTHTYEYGLCTGCGDYKGITLTRGEGGNEFLAEDVSFSAGANYVRFTLTDDVDQVDCLRLVSSMTGDKSNMETNDKVNYIFIYDSVAGPYTIKFDSDYSATGTIELDSSIYGSDGLRTIYVVFNCQEDCEFVYIDFIS